MNQIIEAYLRTFCAKAQENWVEKLTLAQIARNNSQHNSTTKTPARLLFGFVPRGPDRVHNADGDTNMTAFDRLDEISADQAEKLYLLFGESATVSSPPSFTADTAGQARVLQERQQQQQRGTGLVEAN